MTKHYNNTQHLTIRGEPAELGKEGHEVSESMALADNADKLQHNQTLFVERKKKVEDQRPSKEDSSSGTPARYMS